MPAFLLSNWRLFAIVGIVIAAFFGGMRHQSLIDNGVAKALQIEQLEANAAVQAEMNKKAKIAELELAAERTKSADLADQWEKERHAKNHIACSLSAATVSLLKSASSK